MKIFGKKVNIVNHENEAYVSISDVSRIFGISMLHQDDWGYHTPKYVRDSYTPYGDYLLFSKMNVENWKMVSMDGEGIPVNNFRWGKYYYPITIAHYGLQLYGEYIRSKVVEPVRYSGVVDACKISSDSKWTTVSIYGGLSTGYEFPGLVMAGAKAVNFKADSAFRFHCEFCTGRKLYKCVVFNGKSYFDSASETYYLTPTDFKRISVMLGCDDGYIKNIKIRGDVEVFFDKECVVENVVAKGNLYKVASWFVDNQSDSGSWLSDFDHVFYEGRTGVIRKGWPSALGQGLALSLLSRLYVMTGDDCYKKSCMKALEPFDVDVCDGGVRREWKEGFPFFEEYPTDPPSFVLNGFIFSLLGLYDCWKNLDSDRARRHFYLGYGTLLDVLPLYDLGSRSAYDLTHYTCGSFPNVARWGYHQTHINQLYALESIDKNEIIHCFRSRWESYMEEGYCCPNN